MFIRGRSVRVRIRALINRLDIRIRSLGSTHADHPREQKREKDGSDFLGIPHLSFGRSSVFLPEQWDYTRVTRKMQVVIVQPRRLLIGLAADSRVPIRHDQDAFAVPVRNAERQYLGNRRSDLPRREVHDREDRLSLQLF